MKTISLFISFVFFTLTFGNLHKAAEIQESMEDCCAGTKSAIAKRERFTVPNTVQLSDSTKAAMKKLDSDFEKAIKAKKKKSV